MSAWRWQRRHNAASPDLAADVDLRCADAAGTAVISARQVHDLERTVDGLSLKGVVPVYVPGPGRGAGQSWTVLLGEHPVEIAAEPAPEMPSWIPAPVALWLEAWHQRRHQAAVDLAF